MNANRKMKKAAAIALSAVLATGISMGNVYAADAGVEKEETVYVRTTATGDEENVIVSDWLKNTEGAETVKDTTSLREIENVKGDETFSQDGETLTWNANGNDIYYQGKVEKELPVSLKVSYYLNDQEMTPEEIAGKSGHVKIKYEYTNHIKNGDIYTPFLLVTSMMLDEDGFSNLEIDHGKIVNDGNRNVVIGFGLPGLKESLKLDSLTFDGKEGMAGTDFSKEIPDGFEVEADVEDFHTSMAMTVATPLDLSEFTTNDIDDWGDIQNKMNELSENSKKLVDGSSALSDGVQELMSGCQELLGGMTQLDAGAGALNDGAAKLYAGLDALDQSRPDLVKGVGALVSGIDQVEGNKAALTGGAGQIAAGLQSVADNLATVQAGSQQVTDGIGGANTALSGNLSQVAGALAQISAGIQGVSTQEGLSPETVATLSQLAGAVDQLNGQVSQLQAGMCGEGGVMPQLAAGSAQVTGGVSQISEGVTNQLLPGSNQLNGGIQTLFASGIDVIAGGLHTLNDKMPALNNGITALKAGAGELYDGTKELKSGTTKLQSGGTTLTDGVQQLLDGSTTLKDGMARFDEEGIQKITGLLGGDVKTFVDRLNAVKDAASAYRLFSEETGNEMDSVKFVIETDGI